MSNDNPTLTMELEFDGEVVEVVLEFHFSDNAEKFFDVPGFVNAAAYSLISDIDPEAYR